MFSPTMATMTVLVARLTVLVVYATSDEQAGELQQVVDANCSATNDCSARLEAALAVCRRSGHQLTSHHAGPTLNRRGSFQRELTRCDISLVPPGAEFHLEQHSALNATGLGGGLALDGNGAQLVLHGDAAFIAVDCSIAGAVRPRSAVGGVTLSNFTLTATRPAFTYGVVVASEPGKQVTLSVDMSLYPMA